LVGSGVGTGVWTQVLDVWTDSGVGGTDGCGVGLKVGSFVGHGVGTRVGRGVG
jgi:hypothetical protein